MTLFLYQCINCGFAPCYHFNFKDSKVEKVFKKGLTLIAVATLGNFHVVVFLPKVRIHGVKPLEISRDVKIGP